MSDADNWVRTRVEYLVQPFSDSSRHDPAGDGPQLLQDDLMPVFGYHSNIAATEAGRRGLAERRRASRAETAIMAAALRQEASSASAFAVDGSRGRRRTTPAPASAARDAPKPSRGEPAEGAAVVVIEDDPAQLTGLEMLLTAWGYRAICARAVDQACAELAARRIVPDVVVSDFRLTGGGTGIDAINTIRAAVGRPVPGIVVTGDTDPLRLREAKESGFRLLHKPYAPEELRSVIAAALSGGGMSGPYGA